MKHEVLPTSLRVNKNTTLYDETKPMKLTNPEVNEMSWFSYIKKLGRRAVSVFDFWKILQRPADQRFWNVFLFFGMISIYYVKDSPPFVPTSERMKFYFENG